MDPPRNLALKNLCEAFIQERHQRASTGSEVLCSLHDDEKFKLFCLECQQPVCLVCRHSEKHSDHSFRPIDEAALDHKEEVQKLLKPLQEKLKVFINGKNNKKETAEYIKKQANHCSYALTDEKQQIYKLTARHRVPRCELVDLLFLKEIVNISASL